MPLIENLQITNFKCFKQLEVKGLGQVNLVGGKNNVGKTAFLEAVELFLATTKVDDLASMIVRLLKKRQNEVIGNVELDFFYKNQKNIKISSDDKKSCQIEWVDKDSDKERSQDDIGLPQDKLILSIASDSPKSIPVNRFISETSLIFAFSDNKISNFISTTKSKEQDIAIMLGTLIELDREDFLNQSISLFDSNILTIKQIITPQGMVVLKLKVKNQNNLVLLSSLGEGINRYIAILCAIWANKDGFLLIDEIENGIHFTNYPKLWEIIFKTSVEANCQLFITTHSKECIIAFNDMQFEVDNCNAQYFELYRNQKTDLITSFARDKDQLRYALTHEGKVRGE